MSVAFVTSWKNETPASPLAITVSPAANARLIAAYSTDVPSGAYTVGSPLTKDYEVAITTDNAMFAGASGKAVGNETSVSTSNAGDSLVGIIASFSGVDTTTANDANPVTAVDSAAGTGGRNISITTATANAMLVVAMAWDTQGTTDPVTTPTDNVGGLTWNVVAANEAGGFRKTAIAYALKPTAGAVTVTLTPSVSAGFAGVLYALKEASAAGIAFDAAGNSGDQAAANTYSGGASWSGTSRMLAIDVSLLGAGTTVTSMTYGGAACTFIGSRSTVTSLGSVECWRICSSDSGAPATGSNTLAVNLSGTIEFTAEWASYTGVHQALPVEAFNSAQATNAGSATDASVAITTVADNCWVHAAVVANDTSITAGNTTRNNISGTLGSGGNEDNNAAKTPAGAVTMSYTGMGLTTTWAIAGYAIRPLAADILMPQVCH